MKKVINVKTQEEYNKVMEIFEKKGWAWADGGSPTNSPRLWEEYKKTTCIRYENNFGFGDIDYYKENLYEIISFEEFLKLEGIEEFKEGEMVGVSDTS